MHVAARTNRKGEKGAALVLALFMVVILTVLGLGLVLRSKVTMAVAGSERPITKNFYSADGGIQAGYARLKVENPCAFVYSRQDVRGAFVKFPVQVNVAQSVQVGDPQEVVGSEVGGGTSGGGNRLFLERWRISASAQENATETRRAIEAEISIGPGPLLIPLPCS
jgi:PilX N-terminal